jgi:ABC-type multidrug transport system fused ATPase/permease subunit
LDSQKGVFLPFHTSI